MSRDFINDLLDSLKRINIPDLGKLRDVLILSGMPDKDKNLWYMAYNRQVFRDEKDRNAEFIAGAVINNRRIKNWRLEGLSKALSRIIFYDKWTFNSMNLYLNNMRCNTQLMDILEQSSAPYTLLGIIKIEKPYGSGFYHHRIHTLRPVIAAPRLSEMQLRKVIAFERHNEIRELKIKRLTLYRTVGG